MQQEIFQEKPTCTIACKRNGVHGMICNGASNPKPKNETSSRNTHCNRCGRLFSDCGGTAGRLNPSKYNCADTNAGQYCKACFYEFNAGYRGRY